MGKYKVDKEESKKAVQGRGLLKLRLIKLMGCLLLGTVFAATAGFIGIETYSIAKYDGINIEQVKRSSVKLPHPIKLPAELKDIAVSTVENFSIVTTKDNKGHLCIEQTGYTGGYYIEECHIGEKWFTNYYDVSGETPVEIDSNDIIKAETMEDVVCENIQPVTLLREYPNQQVKDGIDAVVKRYTAN